MRTMWQAGGRKRVQSEEARIAKTTTGLEDGMANETTPHSSESESPFLLMIIELGEALQPVIVTIRSQQTLNSQCNPGAEGGTVKLDLLRGAAGGSKM